MRSALTLALLLALPLVAQAQPIELTGTNTARFAWECIPGADSYESKIIYADGTEGEHIISPSVIREFQPRRGIDFQMVYRVCRRYGDPESLICDGPWIGPGPAARMCPLRSDINCEPFEGKMIVGGKDFVILSGDWGQTASVEAGDE